MERSDGENRFTRGFKILGSLFRGVLTPVLIGYAFIISLGEYRIRISFPASPDKGSQSKEQHPSFDRNQVHSLIKGEPCAREHVDDGLGFPGFLGRVLWIALALASNGRDAAAQ